MRYTLGEEIGRGAYGIVRRAHAPDGTLYAVKTLNFAAFSPAEVPTLVRRFEREVRYQAQVSHPNVVSILHHNLSDTPPWFVMPLATGSLADDIDADRTLGGDPRRPLFDILAGLEALHDKGFSHRDLKPANVLKFVTTDGSVQYKISDFGLTTPGVGQTTTLTAPNMAGGTVLYRAPECANNFRRATDLADIYSFGAVLHDIFQGGPRVPHSRLSVAGPVRSIVEKCTESNSRRRYRSVARLREELFRVLQNGEIRFDSQEEENIVNLILQKNSLSDEDWDLVFNTIDENEDHGDSNYNIVNAISGEQIDSLADASPDMFHGLGEIYAKFATAHSFPFDYCDIVSDKAEIFYRHGDLRLKAVIALAMLELGTSHNRWRVEHQFMRMAGTEISDALAERMTVEIEVQHVDFACRIQHVESSIPVTRDQLHPALRNFLNTRTKLDQ